MTFLVARGLHGALESIYTRQGKAPGTATPRVHSTHDFMGEIPRITTNTMESVHLGITAEVLL